MHAQRTKKSDCSSVFYWLWRFRELNNVETTGMHKRLYKLQVTRRRCVIKLSIHTQTRSTEAKVWTQILAQFEDPFLALALALHYMSSRLRPIVFWGSYTRSARAEKYIVLPSPHYLPRPPYHQPCSNPVSTTRSRRPGYRHRSHYVTKDISFDP